MPKQNISTRIGRIVVGACLLIGLVGPAFAGNVYSWVTDDGTYAFTDDPKRIPAKHKAEAKARPMGDLKRYGRYQTTWRGGCSGGRLGLRRWSGNRQSGAHPGPD